MSNEKEKLLLQKEKREELIVNFKKSIELCAFLNDDEITFNEIRNASFDIILNGLVECSSSKQQHVLNDTSNLTSDSSMPSSSATGASSYNDSDSYTTNKVIDDFEWVLNAVHIRNSSQYSKQTAGKATSTRPSTPSSVPSAFRQKFPNTDLSEPCIIDWLRRNLNQSVLFIFLQYLVSDKELLEEHYTSEAFLRHEKYVDALFICISAFETRQFGLLKQIDSMLKEGLKRTPHKRYSSQPNVIVLVPGQKSQNGKEEQNVPHKVQRPSMANSVVLLTIRKTKSLPDFKTPYMPPNAKEDCAVMTDARPRCKTISDIKQHKHTKPRNIPQVQVDGICRLGASTTHIFSTSSGESLCGYDHQRPSTSQNTTSSRNKSPTSSSSMHLNSTNSTISSSLMSASMSSSNSNTTAKRIQLINTDNIKIWTDHTWEQRNKHSPTIQSTATTQPTPIPTAHHLPVHKSSKSLSPLNSFFSSLFSTPPSYTSWYTDHNLHEEDQMPEAAIDSINTSDGQQHHQTPTSLQSTPSSLSSAVFEKFLPIYGKKLRSRKTQTLFDDVSTALDYSTPPFTGPTKDVTASTSNLPTTTANCSPTMADCQSLTKFLKMAHSRNDTELEKENAHFRISEAIISAIEHIKWNKQGPHMDKLNIEATALATDCLSSSERKHPTVTLRSSSVTTHEINECEQVPYAEDVPVESLSAEVVGLSLISKFDEEHLPKVSELKWLVSDSDTPQSLLPMPDLSSNNPDENIIHSVTRGTKYWAPPRQQIIFTDHPSDDRKELMKKQNFRCAGCGMRVSPQYVQSFRYCTYLGKYLCTGCHRNQISATPAKILQNWDFKCYPVSVFAYRLLEQMSSYPLFYVPDLNPALYFRSKALLSARNKRLQLKYVKDFIRTCRFAVREQTYFESVPDYLTSDLDNWSMSDFIDARSNCLHRSIDELIIKCENHIFNCVLCTARGFLCEYCNTDSVIYPWDSRVIRCDRCGSCFHRNCWKSMSLCCRCQRIDKRQEIDDSIHDV
ncbi:run domain Beclin-1-interacting and cysteine-rich domain-containing protein rubicon [Haematobia irritans]|uniref:run domain Beclin-1-interacting and cysteine-rich domain-containing protein rubicon n=1 Tax=Haematobia irritans TaxID=7368 RepID=UPI003F4F8292